ncbi:O-antigen ligase family protein [Erythrobacter sp.]|uniref:O-antigen ligase family protein n=1 Tax=Erythrobacter sp. TaxID=1042 RepID=UPI001B022500|nr:O-antigen ligase family protein [Erythrobacter sp.]MBO6526338.1 O-antigen ligase family protein [Erythrobacter sp.]MBO6530591.1 O-antigen ligase family protein [Erythrobacter sp.]
MIGSRERLDQSGVMSDVINKSWMILAFFAVIVALAGGASRFDAIQIVPLRSLSAFFLVSSLFYLTRQGLRAERTLIILFTCLTLLVLLQLVPLPPALWQDLPGRTEIAQMDAALGFEAFWRPLSLAPMRSWNVLGSLVVPAAGLLLAIASGVSSLTLLRIIAGLGVLNALLGLLQIVSGESGIFYFYEITNRGSSVGFFANENHAAVFAACSMLVLALLNSKIRESRRAQWERLIYPGAFFLIFFVSLAGNSRAGFVAAVGAVLASSAMLALTQRTRRGLPSANVTRRWFDEHPRLVLAVPLVIVLLTVAAFLALDRTPAARDILARDSFEDLRWSLWPVIVEMLEHHWVLGAGFGSFEQVYHIYEPSSLLLPRYVNQAHNDWAQFIIEGGVLACLLLIGLLIWMASAIGTMSLHRTRRVDAIFWMTIFAIIAAASIVDYPLRTPLFQVITIWLLVALSKDARDMKAT